MDTTEKINIFFFGILSENSSEDNMRTIFVLVDALKGLYLTKANMPFLYELSRNYYYIKKIIPSPGFCERSEIFTGLSPFDNGFFTAIGFDPVNSEYQKRSLSIDLCAVVEKLSYRYGRKMLSRHVINSDIKMKPYLIPTKSLPYFALTEDGLKKYITHTDIFCSLEQGNKKYSLEMFTSLSDKAKRYGGSIESNIKRLINDGIDFIPVYVGDIDFCGHKYGNDISSFKNRLLEIDLLLNKLFELAESNGCAFAVLGDHGMVPISQRIDIIGRLSRLKIQHHKDYELFLDSTYARFWFFNNYVQKEIYQVLTELSEYGDIIDKTNYIENSIPLDVTTSQGDLLYGNVLWCAKPGVLISPDFFHSKSSSIMGMHGYLNNTSEHSYGLYISSDCKKRNKVIESASLKSICGSLCEMLEIDKPNNHFERTLYESSQLR